MTATDPRIARIQAKLARIRDRQLKTFGADVHGFMLAPPLADDDISRLESRHQCVLPEAYRLFLTQAGASGAGPYYGLVPPARWGELLYGDVVMPDWAARPCLWTEHTPRDHATWLRLSADLDEPFQGAIVLAEQGCAYFAALVVTGPARGRVLYINLDGGAPYFPECDDFLVWYERWLDELAWGHQHHWFGTGMPGDESTLAAAASRPDSPRRRDALQAMHRLPALTAETVAIVAARVDDDDPAVRAAALDLATHVHFKPLAASIEAQARRALSDPASGVRHAALRAVIAAGGAWHDDLRHALDDLDDDVATLAVRQLDQAQALAEDDLLRLLARRPGDVRDNALWAASTTPSPRLFDVLFPLARGDDRDGHPLALGALLAQVRRNVVTAAQRAAALGLLLELLARPLAARGRIPEIRGLTAFVPEDPRALATLHALTRHPDGFIRYEAATVLGEIGDAESRDVLHALTADPTMPKGTTATGTRSTAWSVGQHARHALTKLEARLAASTAPAGPSSASPTT